MTNPVPPSGIPQYAPDSYPVTQGQLQRCLNDIWSYMLGQTEIITQLGEKVSVTQADLDALTAQVTSDVTAINADVTAINSEIAALQAANPALDLSGVQAALGNLGTSVSNLNTTANPPAPTPAPPAS